MTLTSRESQVVELLRQRQVAAYNELAQQLEVSGKTVQRALQKAGAYASLNANSTYVTLKRTPRFDSRGLWRYEQLASRGMATCCILSRCWPRWFPKEASTGTT